MTGAAQKLDCGGREKNIPNEKQLADHPPQASEQNEKTQKGNPLVRPPLHRCKQSQQSKHKKNHDALDQGKYDSVRQDSNRIPEIGALRHPGNIPERHEQCPKMKRKGTSQKERS
jgi:hypothetical protein